MANVQAQFEQFHETIKLRRFRENQVLREKRDIIRDKLRERLPEVFTAYGEECPPFHFRDQGSYEMRTGTKPWNGDYDIDQGLYFEVGTDAYPDPVVLKRRVHEALEGHTKDVQIRQPCVTVYYQRKDEPLYHVDLAVYSDGTQNADGKDRLAKGREHSTAEYRVWEISNPEKLKDTILARFASGNDRDQFRRVVRYLKRWRDKNFSSDGFGAPLGIGLTVAAANDLQPTYIDVFAAKADDLRALRSLVNAILNRCTILWDDDEQKLVSRLIVKLPVEPWNDLFVRMTNRQMETLKDKLEKLLETVDAAVDTVDPVDACTKLRTVFGKDFPIPEPEETAKRHPPAIVSSSNSA